MQAVEVLKKRLAETQSMTAGMDVEHAKMLAESAHWLSETELAISEMSLSIEARKVKMKALMEEYEQYQASCSTCRF